MLFSFSNKNFLFNYPKKGRNERALHPQEPRAKFYFRANQTVNASTRNIRRLLKGENSPGRVVAYKLIKMIAFVNLLLVRPCELIIINVQDI